MASDLVASGVGERVEPTRARRVLPDVEIITRRLRLRAYNPTDVEEHRKIFDHELARSWSIAPQPYDRGLARDWCVREATRIRTSGDGICWAGEDRETGRVVGMTGFHRTDWEQLVTEVSATAAAPVLGKGYASEALKAISHWLLIEQRFQRIQIIADVRNKAPQHVAEACGFVFEGVLRNGGKFRGATIDTALYSLIPDDLAHLPEPDYQVRPPGPSTTAQREMEMT